MHDSSKPVVFLDENVEISLPLPLSLQQRRSASHIGARPSDGARVRDISVHDGDICGIRAFK